MVIQQAQADVVVHLAVLKALVVDRRQKLRMHGMDVLALAQGTAPIDRELHGDPSVFGIHAQEGRDGLVAHVLAQQSVIGVQHLRIEKGLAAKEPLGQPVVIPRAGEDLHARRLVLSAVCAKANFEPALKSSDMAQSADVQGRDCGVGHGSRHGMVAWALLGGGGSGGQWHETAVLGNGL